MRQVPEVILRTRARVGEGPIWDNQKQNLFWIDVLEGKVSRFDPLTGINSVFSIGKHVGAIALTDSHVILVAARDELLSLDLRDSSLSGFQHIVRDENIRFNDGRVDARGRFVIGTMGYNPQPGTAAVYSVDGSGAVETMIKNVGLSNGLCWTEDNRYMYYIDTLSAEVTRFSYDLETGKVSNRSTLIKFESSQGLPDGMTIDCEGNLWIGFWGGGCIRRVSAQGKIISEHEIPVSRVTSAAFGGQNLDKLFITTASHQLSEEEFQREPLAGSIFVLQTDTQGRPEYRMKLTKQER